MLSNYIKIALRNLWKHKNYALINTVSLCLGITCFILIFLYVRHELGYDKYHHDAENIYRLEMQNWAATPLSVAPYMLAHYPEVEAAVRFYRPSNPQTFRQDDRAFTEPGLLFADSTVFEMFNYTLLEGDPKTVLTRPNTLVITEDMARKYFPDSNTPDGYRNPLGEKLQINDDEFQISGLMANVPHQSHFRFDFLTSFASLKFPAENFRIQWRISIVYSYLRLNPNVNLIELQEKVCRMYEERVEADSGQYFANLNPLLDIHLHSNAEKELSANSSIAYIYIFTSVAIFVLLVACINFMNLATASSISRAKEVGMRKVLGAKRPQLIMQFLGESFLLTFIALLLAMLLVALLLPHFRDLSGLPLTANYWEDGVLLPLLLGILTIVSLFAGSYPAFYLSRYQPVKVLKTARFKESVNSGIHWLRKGLVVFQFVVSIVLIIGSGIIVSQLDHIRDMDLGMNKDQVLVASMNQEVRENYQTLKNELLAHPEISHVTASFSVPSKRIIVEYLLPEATPEDGYATRLMLVDFDYVATYGLNLLEGHGFSRELLGDSAMAFILNERAKALFGWEDALHKQIKFPAFEAEGNVVGVVKDFNFASLHSEVEPLVMLMMPNSSMKQHLSIRFEAGKVDEALNALKSTWAKLYPMHTLDYFFQDDNFARMYQAESKMKEIVSYFTVLAIIIACLGLFGLASFTVVQRTREIGIRKVHGASAIGIVGLLSKEFILLVLVANIITWPIAWYAMDQWLQNFAYRVDISWGIFALAGGLALAIALLTVSTQVIRTALANPIESLRHE